VHHCIKSIKPKICKGFDRIPVGISIYKKVLKGQLKIINQFQINAMCSKSLKKLVFKEINYLESRYKLNLSAKQQQGFTKSKRTATQSLIAHDTD
jgi:hypothetical protein